MEMVKINKMQKGCKLEDASVTKGGGGDLLALRRVIFRRMRQKNASEKVDAGTK